MGTLGSFLFGRNSKAVSEVVHPELGKLVFEDEGWWKGAREIEGQTVHFFINDDGNGLEDGIDMICLGALERFGEYDQQARSKIAEYVMSWGAESPILFDPELFWFSLENGDVGFTLGFNEVGDSGRLWRVRFENAAVVDVGFDD